MNSKHLKFLGLFLLGLIALWGLQQQMARRSDDQVASLVKLDPGVDPVSVSQIKVVLEDSDALTLIRENENWIVQEATQEARLARTEDVDTLLKILDGIDVELVSQNAQRQEELGLTDETAYRIEYGNGESVDYTLLVSRSNPRLVRQQGRENVYRWGFDQSRLMNTNVQTWLAPTPTPAPEGGEPDAVEVSE